MLILFILHASQIFIEENNTLVVNAADISQGTYKQYQDKTEFINFVDDVNLFENSAFRNWPALISVIISNSVVTISDFSFYSCNELSMITLSNSVKSIGISTFQKCTSLLNITIPNSVTSIGSSAFRECTSLSIVTIPSSVTSIGSSAFRGCNINITFYQIQQQKLRMNCFILVH